MSVLSKAFSCNNSISLEAAVVTPPESGAKREDEIVIYAKVNDFTGLKKAASKESHEQWEVKAPFGKIRIRKTTVGDLDPTYSQAIKRRDQQVGILGGTELEIPSTVEAFEALKSITDNGMIKDRYVFKPASITVPGLEGQSSNIDLKYEVDVFPDGHGGYHQWCKIDIEVNDLLDRMAKAIGPNKKIKLTFSISDLPFKPTEMINGASEKLEDKEKIDYLYKEIFRLKKNAAGDIRTTTSKKTTETLSVGLTTPTDDSDEALTENNTDSSNTKPPKQKEGGGSTEAPNESQESNENDELTNEEPQKVSVDETNKEYIQEHLEKFKGKSFKGTRTGDTIKFTDDDGTKHELKSSWGVRGVDVPITVKFDENGELKEELGKNETGTLDVTKS